MKAIDFFCGAGGVTFGFKQAGINVLGGIDFDEACQETYEKNNNTKFLLKDITELKISSLITEFGIEKNDDEMIFIGCSPCQYYTNLKTDKTKSKESRMLLEDFQEFVEYYKPGYIFIENVPGFDRTSESPLGKFKKFLNDNKYTFVDDIINAKDYGIPQNRRRYVLLATRLNRELNIPDKENNKYSYVREAIGDYKVYKPIEAGHNDKTSFQHTAARLSALNLKRIKETKHNGGCRRDWADNPELQLKCYIDHEGHWDVYGRMKWDKVSPAITTRFNSYSNGRYGHPEQDRAISLREGATLQSFDLDYIFYSTNKAKITQMIGNAVPPKLAQKVALELIKSVNEFTKNYR